MKILPTEKPYDFVRLASAANPFLAHIWQNALEREGIPCKVFGDYLDAGLGDISGLAAEVWVEPANLVRAEQILQQHEGNSEEAS
ncbi:DUF2007 domain-containing protein [Telmatocola sphagniphila]|jgi:hypothetical protein|uniref:DUF2007 domain-containing protein n=1 Tax=Telmatocola sphagniphila TaxID=1123043 RepID=A0A8E6BBZ6_9BACT|nr:DUF2007 domain-containing protein [Telmatocola sphagniphila]QVL34085.1 DUF2007 domain-containing protein [Telmatocola sphagniphila]